MNYIVQISDLDGKACRLKLNLPFIKSFTITKNSTWQVLDEGYFKIRSGGCRLIGQNGHIGPGLLKLYFGEKIPFLLYGFIDTFGLVNATGDGSVDSDYCVSFLPAQFNWTVLE